MTQLVGTMVAANGVMGTGFIKIGKEILHRSRDSKNLIREPVNGVMILHGFASMAILKCVQVLWMMITAGNVRCLR